MIDIGLGHYLTLSAIIFTIGIIGIFLNRKPITNDLNTEKNLKKYSSNNHFI